MLGSMDNASIRAFWDHCKDLAPWKQHPIFATDYPLDCMIPLTVHADGAQFYREDEMFVYSISSLLAPSGVITDILLVKFPFLVIPERHMRSESVARQSFRKRLKITYPQNIYGFTYNNEICMG